MYIFTTTLHNVEDPCWDAVIQTPETITQLPNGEYVYRLKSDDITMPACFDGDSKLTKAPANAYMAQVIEAASAPE